MKPTLREGIAKGLVDRHKEMVNLVAEQLERPSGAVKLTEDQERDLFWRRAIDVDAEMALAASGKTPEEVARAVYPTRWELAQLGGRSRHLRKQVEWAEKYAAMGPRPEPVAAVGPEGFAPSVDTLMAEGGYDG